MIENIFSGTAVWDLRFLDANYYLKLDQIKISGVQTFKFQYSNDPARRLRLDKVQLYEPSVTSKLNEYAFSYNSTYLPDYNSKLTDNWGYYNGKNYNAIAFDQMYTYRSPDSLLMKAEILEKITYPTGGVTLFEYQKNDYSKIAHQYPDFSLESTSGIAGGLRIKKIISRTKESDIANQMVKEYSYLNEDNSSSGILSGIPVYTANGNSHVAFKAKITGFLWGYWASADFVQNYDFRAEHFLNPLGNTNGNHITYSRVVEKRQDGSSTIYKYSNHDGFRDEANVNTVNNIDKGTLFDSFTSKELERGLLLSEEHRNSQGKTVSLTVNQYNNDTTRYNEFVKTVDKIVIAGLSGKNFVRVSANKIYTFYPYLKQQTKTAYSLNGTDPVVSDVEYAYDTYKNITKETITQSDGEYLVNNYRYPGYYEWAISAQPKYKADSAVKNLLNANIQNALIEKYTVLKTSLTTSGRVISGTFNVYDAYKPLLKTSKSLETNTAIPEASFTASIAVQTGSPQTFTIQSDSRYKDKINLTYDQDKNNLLLYQPVDGVSKGYIWGYSDQYPIAEVNNIAGSADMAYSGFEGDDSGNWTIGSPDRQSNYTFAGNKSYLLASGTITKTGLTPATEYTVTYWTRNTSPYSITGTKTGYPINISATNGWNCYEHKVTGVSNLTISGTGYIDELRCYPVTAQMSSYTYDPFAGITSMMDEKGNTLQYLYDDIKRLKFIKDQEGNTIKDFCYNYLNGVTNPCTTYFNTALTASYTKACSAGETGSTVTFTVPAGRYFSTVSQAAADAMAAADRDASGQNYANVMGTCTQPSVYVKLKLENGMDDATGSYYDVVLYFYSDAACTVPLSVTNLTVLYKVVETYYPTSSSVTDNYSIQCNGNRVLLQNMAPRLLFDRFGDTEYLYDYILIPSGNYVIK